MMEGDISFTKSICGNSVRDSHHLPKRIKLYFMHIVTTVIEYELF